MAEDPDKLLKELTSTLKEAMLRTSKAEKTLSIATKKLELYLEEGDWESAEKARADVIEALSAAVDLKIEMSRKSTELMKRHDRLMK